MQNPSGVSAGKSDWKGKRDRKKEINEGREMVA
jgi:hypothetical protein